MGVRIQTTNADESSDLIEVDEHEFIDLQRMGLVRAGKGDVGDDGQLTKKASKSVSDETRQATGAQPVLTNGAQ